MMACTKNTQLRKKKLMTISCLLSARERALVVTTGRCLSSVSVTSVPSAVISVKGITYAALCSHIHVTFIVNIRVEATLVALVREYPLKIGSLTRHVEGGGIAHLQQERKEKDGQGNGLGGRKHLG
jgi:hypothetical protein